MQRVKIVTAILACVSISNVSAQNFAEQKGTVSVPESIRKQARETMADCFGHAAQSDQGEYCDIAQYQLRQQLQALKERNQKIFAAQAAKARDLVTEKRGY